MRFGKLLIRHNISRDFRLVTYIVIFVVAFLVLVIGSSLYSAQYGNLQLSYEEQSNRVNTALNDLLDYIEYDFISLGEKIANMQSPSVQAISDLFHSKSFEELRADNPYSWTLFDWILPNKLLVINTKYGIFPHPIPIIGNRNLDETTVSPWKLFFGALELGTPSGQWIIPIVMGVSNSKNEYIGALGTGLKVDNINNKLQSSITKEDLGFILLDKNLVPITVSRNLASNALRKEIHEILINDENLTNLNDANSLLIKPGIRIKNYVFQYIIKSEKFPFYILLGRNLLQARAEFLADIVPRMAELVFMGSFSIAVLYFFRIRVLRPLLVLSDSANKITISGEKVVIPRTDYPEINSLADKLEKIQEMKQELIIARERLQAAYEQMEDKVRERTLELAKALEAKTEFLNNLSHEVRIPIQGVTAISQGLVDHWDSLDSGKKFELAKQTAKNAMRLFALVNDILDIAKFNAGKFTFSKHLCNIKHLTQEVLEEFKLLLYGQKKLSVVLKSPDNLMVYCDPSRISQVIRNLLSNSIKFSDMGEISIDIGYDKSKKNMLFTIKDNGIGIPDNELSSIFRTFVQSERTKTRAGGTGLGLNISKNIIEGHGGKIWAEQNQPKGAIFYFTIPLKHKKLKAHKYVGNNNKISKLDPHLYNLQSDNIVTLDKSANMVHGKKIIVIDDEHACLTSFSLIMHNMPYELQLFDNPMEALEYIKNNYQDIQLIFLDLMMPHVYGLDVLHMIRDDPNIKDIRVVLQTGISDRKEIERAEALGISGVLTKPYDKKQFIELFTSLVN